MKKKTTSLLILAALISGSAYAAQMAKVELPRVEVRDGPGTQYRVLTLLKRGQEVVASNLPTEGYYKVRVGEELVGFVPANGIVVAGNELDQNGSGGAGAGPSRGLASTGLAGGDSKFGKRGEKSAGPNGTDNGNMQPLFRRTFR